VAEVISMHKCQGVFVCCERHVSHLPRVPRLGEVVAFVGEVGVS
jgi:hypothetical protein